MNEYICEYCQLPITHERIEVAYIDGRLTFFHPQRCPRFEGTNCAGQYFLQKGGELDLLSTTRKDLEQNTKEILIELLLNHAAKSRDG